MAREKSITKRVLNYIFTRSKQPVLLKDLLVATKQYNQGMEVDAGRLGFRLKLSRAYIVYIILVCLVLIPVSLLTHTALAKIDSHISIVGGMVITALIFMGFNFFRDKVVELMTKEVITRAWSLHFPYFAFEEYSKKFVKIFDQAMKEEVSKRDLQKYILEKISSI
jgi:hypothetical protein